MRSAVRGGVQVSTAGVCVQCARVCAANTHRRGEKARQKQQRRRKSMAAVEGKAIVHARRKAGACWWFAAAVARGPVHEGGVAGARRCNLPQRRRWRRRFCARCIAAHAASHTYGGEGMAWNRSLVYMLLARGMSEYSVGNQQWQVVFQARHVRVQVWYMVLQCIHCKLYVHDSWHRRMFRTPPLTIRQHVSQKCVG